MPLLDLKTDLKSLKYGHDTPGGGDSNQPYIQTNINKVNDTINKAVDDGLVRGGIVGATKAAVTDTLRIGKFLTDFPKGPLFIVKQVGLQLSNPRLEVPKNPINILSGGISNTLSVGTNGFLQPTRIYNLGINTIAQIPVNAFGVHFDRHGILPVQNEASKYEAVVTANNNLSQASQIAGNAFASLTGAPVALQATTEFVSSANRLFNLTKELQLSSFSKPTLQKIQTGVDVSNRVGTPSSTKSEFLYKNTKTGTIYKSSQIDTKNPAINAKLTSGEIIGIGIDPSSGGTQEEVFVGNKKTTLKLNYPSSPEPRIQLGSPIPSLSYLGGPNSVYGIGSTNIQRYSITNYNPNQQFFKEISKSTTQNLTRLEVDSSDNEISAVLADVGLSLLDSRLTKYIDPTNANSAKASIRDNTVVEYKTIIPSLRNYNRLIRKIATTTQPKYFKVDNDGNQSPVSIPSSSLSYINSYADEVVIKGFSNWNAISREQRVGSGRQDSINLTPIFGGTMKNGVGEKYWMDDKVVTIDGETHNIRDLVKFRISSVLTDTPDKVNTMVFRAYLTSLTDSVDATWNPVKYAGRGNPFYVYDSFTRKVQIGFKVAALSREEMQPMYSKLNYLMSNLMPNYDGIGRLMRGPLVRMTVGNYFDAQLGKLDSLSYTIPNDSPWEIALDEPEGGTKQLILPHVLEVSLGFTPIGAETQGENRIESKVRTNTYIAQNNTGADKDTIQYYDYFKNKFD